ALRVVERERIQSILQEQDLIKSKSIDPQTAVKLGKILGAQYMVTGGFMSDGKGTLVLTSHVISVESSAITNPVKLQAKTDDGLGIIGQPSEKLNSDMKLGPPPARQAGDAGGPQKPADGAGQSKPAGGDAGSQASTGTPVRMAVAQPTKSTKLDVRTALLYSK